MNTIFFNTGNGYTQHGQRIGAVVLDDKTIVFYDKDRMIDGHIPADFMPEFPPRERVMAGYMWNEVDYGVTYVRFPDFEEYTKYRAKAEEAASMAPSLAR